jgi:hypothetical protein
MQHGCGTVEVHTGFSWGDVMASVNLEDPGADWMNEEERLMVGMQKRMP